MNPISPVLTEVAERCPGCGAAARADAGWCSLCFAPLRPEPVQAEEPALPDVRRAPEAVAPLRVASRGRHARPHDVAGSELLDGDLLDGDLPDGVGRDVAALDGEAQDGGAHAADPLLADAMLARLAAESDDPLGALAGRLDSAAAKAVAISVGVLVMIAVIIGLMFGLGSLF